MRKWSALLFFVVLGITFIYAPSVKAGYDELPAFPGAEGFGYAATGGRGGEVYHVTSYELTGPGTFHDALTTVGDTPRTIVFDISGEITIPQIIVRNKSNITIAGQTAPGEGVTIRGNNIRFINCKDIIIRYLRFRMGSQHFQDDTMYFENCENVIIDHSSFSWGTDEVLSILSKDYNNPKSKNITVQWSIISEGLLTHSMGGLIEMNTITMHHNLYAHNNDRNPKTKGQIDFVNNIVYNWGGYPYVAGGESGTKGYGNVVGNYFIAGLNSANPEYAIVRGNENYSLFLENNRIDSNKNGVLDGIDTGSGMMEAERPSVLVPERFEYPPVHTQEPEAAYEYILQYSGASLHRDAVDERIINDVRQQTGVIIGHENDVGGFPELLRSTAPLDTDRDGMPDDWEIKNGLDPHDPEDRNGDWNGDGYTNLEDYLHELAAPGFPLDYPMVPPSWSGTPFEPPVIPEPEPEEPEPSPSMDGKIIRNVKIHDNSSNGVANAAAWSVQDNLQAGDFVAGDRMTGSSVYRFVTVPETVAGLEWIRSAVGSRSASSEDLLSFFLTADAEVYVGHDSRISTKPHWLASNYENTGLIMTDDQPVSYELYKKSFPAGSRVVMGANGNTSRMNYFVIVKETSPDEEPPTDAPDSLSGSLIDGPAATLQWIPVDGAEAYIVYRSSTLDPYFKAIGSTEAETFLDEDIQLGAAYQYKVSAVNAGGESPHSHSVEILAFDPSQPIPSAPSGLEVTAARSLSVELAWTPVDGAVGYGVYRTESEDDSFENVGYSKKAMFIDRNVEPSTTYDYRVSVMTIGGESSLSDVVSAVTKPPVEKPEPPLGLTAAEVSPSAFRLAWQSVDGAEEYNIYRKGSSENNFMLLGSTTVPEYKDASISVGQSGYSYYVTAVNEKGESEASAVIDVDLPLPEAPTNLFVGLTGESFVGLIWTSHGGATQYHVYRSTGDAPAEYVGYAKVDTFYDRTVEPRTEYTYFIKAVNGAGESEASNAVKATTIGTPSDTTPPVTTTDAVPGWHHTAQEIKFVAVDPEGSAVSTYYSVNDEPFVLGNQVILSEEGIHTLRYYSVDAAGNKEDAQSVEVSIDLTPPSVHGTVPESVYRHETVVLQFDITDELSGIDEVTITWNGTDTSLPIELLPYSLPVGDHEMVVTASDLAGNVTETSLTLQIRTEIDLLDEALEAAYEQGWIFNHGVLNSLLAKVNKLQTEADAKKIRNAWNALEKEVSALAGKQIDAKFAEQLLLDLEYVKP